jgi:diguanylate cyclase (GGDEF)-like protein/PAS domain S-box-containing protein
VLGFDLGAEERRRETIDAALRQRRAVASRPITLILDQDRLPVVLVMRPVFGTDGAGGVERLRGFASTALVGRDLVEQAIARSAPLGIDFAIYELRDAERGMLIHSHQSRARAVADSALARYFDLSRNFRHVGSIDVSGQPWQVVSVPAQGYYFAGVSGAGLGVLLGGLLTTALLFFYVRSLYLSAARTLLANEALRLRERAIQASTNAIMILARGVREERIEYVNPAFERITGYCLEEVRGRDWRVLHGGPEARESDSTLHEMLRRGDEGAVTIRSRRRDGTPFWCSVHVAPVRNDDGRVTHYVGILDDVTETKSYQAQLEHQATHDELTGLPNRALLLDRIAQGIAHARREACIMGVLFIDLDHFKRINDGYGHGAGDEVLRMLSRRLGTVLRAGDTVARYGGDEFIVVVNGHGNEDDVLQFSRRLAHAISEPMQIGGNELLLSCSVGVSLFPRDGSDAQTLLQHADSAMYRVKDEGRGAVRFYTEEISAEMHARLSLEQSLRRALERSEFFLEYQPRVDVRSGRVCGAEALVRWEHPQHGRVAPGEFIGLAEDTGLILPVGAWVLEEACRKAAQWAGTPATDFPVSVNLSPRQFRQKDLVNTVAEVLAKTGLSPGRLQIEVTESSMMQDVEQATGTLKGLNALGVRLALDDFGTGYSSLAYLKTFPIDDLKIDRSFVRDVILDGSDAQIARAIIGLAHNLGLRVVAEGIENLDQLKFLCENGCDEGQGFYFARPLREAQFQAWAQAWSGLPEELREAASGRVVPIRR